MTSSHLYDFVTGARIQLPTGLRTGVAVEVDGRHGLRAILTPDEKAQALLRDQMRMLSKLSRAAPDS